MRDSKARLVTTAIVAASRFPFPRLYRSPGNPIGKSIDYLDFATIELPGPAYRRKQRAGLPFGGVLPHDNARNIELPVDPRLLPELL